MSRLRILVFLLILCLAPLLTACTAKIKPPQQELSVYDRVIKAGKIRCAYIPYPPACIKDPNTGKLSGIFVEALTTAGKNLGLKIDWTEEVGWGSAIEGLELNRYDLVGTAMWTNSARGKVADFTKPLFYSTLGVYARPGDNRFKNNLAAINSPAVKIATIDGETGEVIASRRFPQATRVSLPQLSDPAQLLLQVSKKKADVAIAEPCLAWQFLRTNPDTIVNITPDRPLAIYGNAMMFRRGQSEFKSMLDNSLDELINTGFIDQLIDKYEPAPGLFYRIGYPYRLPKNDSI